MSVRSQGASSASALSPKDRKILAATLAVGHAFEKSFTVENESEFRAQLEGCADGDSILIRKLAELAPKVSLALGPKHLMTLLVPLERLAGRSARDEEFLYFETDGERYLLPFCSDENEQRSKRIVLCENIRSAFNVGSVFRTAETFGGDEIWLCGYTPEPMKTAMGTDELVANRRFERTADAIGEARKLGFKVVGFENAPGAVPLESFDWPENTLLILGNERFGVDSQTLADCDAIVRISTSGQKNSLNVGTAFGIAAASWRKNHETPTEQVIRPIGFLRGGFKNPQVAPRQGAYVDANASAATIELDARFEGRPSNFDQALKDLEGFERAWIIFGFDRSEGWQPQVRPPRGDGAKRGLFATRSPHRPNRLGISCVKIESVSGRTIVISEHDLLDGTPIYDIKPYVPGADAFPDANAGWVDRVSEAEYQIVETDGFRQQVDWLESQGEKRIRSFIDEQLRFQPFDQARKRVELAPSPAEPHVIAFRTWRIDFREKPNRILEIVSLRSGYDEAELKSSTDPYEDKDLHRAFRKAFHE